MFSGPPPACAVPGAKAVSAMMANQRSDFQMFRSRATRFNLCARMQFLMSDMKLAEIVVNSREHEIDSPKLLYHALIAV